MKAYPIIITIVAIFAVIGAVYFYTNYNGLAEECGGVFREIENCQEAKAEIERQLTEAQEQLLEISNTSDVLLAGLSAFMIPGDLKAITVGSQESAKVSQKISNIADSKDRMMMEENWNDFSSSKTLNSLFIFLRDGVNNIERTLTSK